MVALLRVGHSRDPRWVGAGSHRWVEGVQLLLQTAANPHSVNIQGYKPKQLAVTGQHRECATLLDEYKDR